MLQKSRHYVFARLAVERTPHHALVPLQFLRKKDESITVNFERLLEEGSPPALEVDVVWLRV